MMGWRLERVDAARSDDFFALHSDGCGHGWCSCVAWWVEGWAGWGERTAEQNRALREGLFARGVRDGFLLYAGRVPIAWCQCAPRDALPGLVHEFEREPDPEVWAIACLLVAPDHRGQGVARRLVAGVLDELRAAGVRRVEAYPRVGTGLEAGEVWTGPLALYRELGFERVGEGSGGRRCVMTRSFNQPSPPSTTP